ncbi:MAG: hypothetical protein M1821_007449 [Bathelium mastoideum]|nr:MAG: hypothetical protein M1821_007449 [Bathelium mastoideum]KAI9694951.1 MAG: hypothetical protein M1822_000568 [Bathelium mastoideum]
MAGRYVPPALRNKAASATAPENNRPLSSSDDNLFTPKEVEAHYWPKKYNVQNEESAGDTSISSTLHASEANPHELGFIVLFRGANPRWFADKIIYAKSNLDLLPARPDSANALVASSDPENGEISKATPSNNQHLEHAQSSKDGDAISPTNDNPLSSPIPVFQEISAPRPRNIRFAGYHTISHLQILQPGSPDLVRMLEQKWSSTDRHGKTRYKERDAESWKRSLAFKWAVIKFARDPRTDETRGAPKVEKRENESGVSVKVGSVNEMLKELRMNEEDKDKVVKHEDEDLDAKESGEARAKGQYVAQSA